MMGGGRWEIQPEQQINFFVKTKNVSKDNNAK